MKKVKEAMNSWEKLIAEWEQTWIHGPNIANPNERKFVWDEGMWIPIDDEEEQE